MFQNSVFLSRSIKVKLTHVKIGTERVYVSFVYYMKLSWWSTNISKRFATNYNTICTKILVIRQVLLYPSIIKFWWSSEQFIPNLQHKLYQILGKTLKSKLSEGYFFHNYLNGIIKLNNNTTIFICINLPKQHITRDGLGWNDFRILHPKPKSRVRTLYMEKILCLECHPTPNIDGTIQI